MRAADGRVSRTALALGAAALALVAAEARADEFSGADRLRAIWSRQPAWTSGGLPVVNIGLAEGRGEVVIEGASRVLPDGDGGSEVRGGATWRVRAVQTSPAKLRFCVVVATARPAFAGEAESLQREAARWRERGQAPRTVETGLLFGLRGQVIDTRRLLLCVAQKDRLDEARAEAKAIAARFSVETTVQAEVLERPRGTVEAKDERGTVVRNEAILWFAPDDARGTLAVPGIAKDAGGALPCAGRPGCREPSAVERRSYGGRLYVTLGADGKLTLVNAVPEDRLLAGLVPSEMMPGSAPEALKAQAVTARNNLLAKLGARHHTEPYALCARTHCQVYGGAGREDPRAVAAVKASRGELLVREGGALVDAVYSAACGGHTEDNDRAWGASPDPALRGVLDVDDASRARMSRFDPVREAEAFLTGALPVLPACATAASFRWTARVEAADLAKRAEVGRVRDVVVVERGVSGRVTRLRLVGDAREREVRGELEVRRVLGGLKSSLVAIALERDEQGVLRALRIDGGGFGHGVGMCQAGAISMAERGDDYRAILRRYYPAATLKKFY